MKGAYRVGLFGCWVLALVACSASQESTRIDSAALGDGRFLVRYGRGDWAEDRAYYDHFVPSWDAHPVSYHVLTFESEHGLLDRSNIVTARYRNKNELGFWREMTCSKVVKRGQGGCEVRNWTKPYAKELSVGFVDSNVGIDAGTVGMDISAQGYVRFYVFEANGDMTPFAVLDREGEKLVPWVCTTCHGGNVNIDPVRNLDVGSVFREFEPSQLEERPGESRAVLEEKLFALNQIVRAANDQIRSEAEGGTHGVDRAKAGVNAHVAGLYPSGHAPAIAPDDVGFVPPSWRGEATREELWRSVVAPACMGCHFHTRPEFAEYENFELLQSPTDGSSLLRDFMAGRQGFTMPQAEQAHELLTQSSRAQDAIDAWTKQCTAGRECAPSDPCRRGTSTCAGEQMQCRATTPVEDGTPCGEGLVCARGRCNASARCKKTILIINDDVANAGSPDHRKAEAKVKIVAPDGFSVAVYADGRGYAGDVPAETFGTVFLVQPFGRVSRAGQDALARAAESGTGLVTMVPFQRDSASPLFTLSSGDLSARAFDVDATTSDHPVFAGLPAHFSTQPNGLVYNARLGSDAILLANETVRWAGGTVTTGPLVAARESTAGGRVVELAFTLPSNTDPHADANLKKLVVNAVRWAAHCDP